VRPAGEGAGVVVLDAGTGIAALGRTIGRHERVDILLSHLHLDHIQGLGFFGPLFCPGQEVHIWGPSSTTLGLRLRLLRYLSPPLFPVALRDLPCRLTIHDVPLGGFELPGVSVSAALVCHPGPTVGYRLTAGRASLAYLPDHEPALGCPRFPDVAQWTSGYDLAHDVDVLIHDAQYTDEEYGDRVGWGHSTIDDAVAFAVLVGARRLVAFHHDPNHDDDFLDGFIGTRATAVRPRGLAMDAAQEGAVVDLPEDGATGDRSAEAS
jgi:phosphoribosyl 1,2-cyclic phosphodiesterase